MNEKRKFVIWLVGNTTLTILLILSAFAERVVMSDLVFRDCFIGLTTAIVVGYAAEYFAKK